MRVGRVVRRVFLFSKRFLGRENEVAQSSRQPISDKGQHHQNEICSKNELTIIFVLNQEALDKAIHWQIPSAGCEDLDILKRRGFGVSGGEHFLPAN